MYVKVNSNGTLGAWTQVSNIPQSICNMAAGTYNNRIYLIGGHTGATNDDAIYGTFNKATGAVDSWTINAEQPPLNPLSNKRTGGYIGFDGGYVYLMAGTVTGVNGDPKRYSYATYNSSDGSLSSWQTDNQVKVGSGGNGSAFGNSDGSFAQFNHYFYFIGGGYGFTASHSLVLQTHISNAASNISVNAGLTVNGDSTFGGDLTVTTTSGSQLLTVDSQNSVVQLLGQDSLDYVTWQNTTPLNGNGVNGSGAAVLNGHIYSVSGGGSSTVQMNTINSNGSLGNSWAATTANLPDYKNHNATIAANNYIYAIGGYDSVSGSAPSNKIYYARPTNSGDITSWTTASSTLPTPVASPAVTVLNGYLYVTGGATSSSGGIPSSPTAVTQWAKLNSDGSLGAFSQSVDLPSGNLPSVRMGAQANTANGYIYVTGGADGTGNAKGTVFYTSVGLNGTPQAWKTDAGMGDNRAYHAATIANGYLYVVGGTTTNLSSSAGDTNAIIYGKLTSSGAISSWTPGDGTLVTAESDGASAAANGYLYILSGSNQPTVQYSSTSRIQVGGSLDLVGLGSTTYTTAGTSGLLTAGDTTIIGTLNVREAASFNQSVSIAGDVLLNGAVLLKNTTDSTSAFSVQTSAGVPVFNVDTINGKVGTPDSTTAPTSDLKILSGTTTVGAGLNSGNVLIDAGAATGTTGVVTIGGSNASALTLGHLGMLPVSLPSGLTTNGSDIATANGNLNLGTGTITSGNINGQTISSTTNFTGSIKAGTTITGTTLNGSTGLNTGALAGTQRIDANGNLVNIGTIASGLINGQTISSSANFTGSVTVASALQGDIVTAATGVNTGAGTGTQRIDASGNLVNIGTISSGLINGQTISSSANFTGTVSVATSLTTPSILSAGAFTLTPGGAATIGSTSQTLTLQGNASTTLSASGGGFTSTLAFASPTASHVYTIPDALVGATDTICLKNLGNCAGAGGGVTTAGGTVGQIAKFSATNDIADSTLSESGSTVTASGSVVIQGAGGLTLGTGSGNNGQVVFRNSANNNTVTLQSGVTTANTVFTLPTADGSPNQCLRTDGSGGLSFANCVGGGGGGSGVTSVNSLTNGITIAGTSNQINVNTAGSTITLSTPQNIGTSSNVSFGSVAATGAGTGLAVTNNATVGGTLLVTNLATYNGGLTVTTGNTFTNASSTLNTAITIPDVASGGNIGTAATTVDVATTFAVNQATAGQTLSLPNPTVTTAGREVFVTNTGSVSFTMSGVIISTGNTAIYLWNGTAWTSAGIDGSGANYIQNQNSSSQTANFRVTGTGRADTALQAPLLDTATATTLALGTTNATGINLNKNTSITGSNTLTVGSGLASFGGNLSVTGTYNSNTFDSATLTFGSGSTATISSAAGLNITAPALSLGTSGSTVTTFSGATLNSACNYANSASNYSINTVNKTVNVCTYFTLAQTSAGITVTVPDPSPTTPGHVIYVSNTGSTSLTLSPASGTSILLNAGVTSTLMWNGTVWTYAGTDASGLQTAYNNSQGGATSEFLLDSTRGAIDIQDASSTIGANLFNIKNSGGGTTLLGVGNTGATTLQNSADSLAALQLKTSGGNALLTADTINSRIGVNVTYASMSVPSGVSVGAVIAFGALTNNTTYYYKVTAIDALGGETTASTEASGATGSGANRGLPVTWTAVTHAIAYKIYRSTSASAEVYLTTVYTNTFNDLGTNIPGAASVPSSNTAYVATNISNNSLQLSIGGNGNPVGQLYVSGTVPSAAAGSVVGGTGPYSLAVQGRYAYSADYTGATISTYDISNPVLPLLRATINVCAGAHGIAVQGHYAYLACYSTGALQIYDITNPSNLALTGSVTTGTNPYSVYVQGRYAFVVDITANTLAVVDVANPASPTVAGSVSMGAGTNPDSVFVQGRYAFVTNNANNTLQAVDVGTPTSPTLAGAAVNTGTTPYSVYVQGRYAYVANYGSSTLQVFDVSNPTSLSLSIGSVSTGGSPYSVYVQGRYAYVANLGGNTLQTIDISNPYAPFSVGSVSTGAGSGPSGVVVQGRWAYVSNVTNSTLQTFDMGGAYVQQLQVGGIETGTLATNGNANIAGDASIQGGLQVGQSLQVSGSLGANGSVALGTNTGATSATLQAGSGGMALSSLGAITIGTTNVASGSVSGNISITTGSGTSGNASAGSISIVTGNAIGLGSTQGINIDVGTGLCFSDCAPITIGTASGHATSITIGSTNQLIYGAGTTIQGGSKGINFNSSGNINLGKSIVYIDNSSYAGFAAGSASAGANTGGTFSGAPGTTYYYKVVASSGLGNDVPSAEMSFSSSNFTPISSPTQAPTQSNVGGGFVTGGIFKYLVTFKTANGETTQSSAVLTTPSLTTKKVTLTLSGITVPTGATGMNIYRTKAGLSTYFLINVNTNGTTCNSVTIPATTCIDNLADASLSAINPPGTNTATTNTNNITVSWANGTGAYQYTLYRGTSSNGENTYFSPVTTPYTDTGAAGTAQAVPTNTAPTYGKFGIGTSSPTGDLTFGGAANKLINVLAGATAGIDMTIQAGSAGSGNNNGGNLYLQGGDKAGSGQAGAVIVKPQSDTLSAFQVQNATNTANIFNVDTTNAKIGTIDTNAASTNSAVLTIKSGNALGTTSNSGNVILDVGTATGTAGTISIGTANTSGINIGRTGVTTTVAGTLTVSGHFASGGTSLPTSQTAAAGAGNTATCTLGANSNDTAGSISLASTGTGQATGLMCTITFSTNFATAPRVVITPTAANAAAIQAYAGSSVSTITLSFGVAPTAGQTYTFNYFAPQ